MSVFFVCPFLSSSLLLLFIPFSAFRVHVKAGEPHAEVLALRDAESSLGDLSNIYPTSTLYVTLEPCHHFGRTPPCDSLVVSKKIGRVVVATLDPDERVKGQGVALIREAGIEVVVGVEEEKAKESLAPYLHHRLTGLPFVVAKVAISIDSKIACRDGTSQVSVKTRLLFFFLLSPLPL
jgi:diaminohydroxyphosphoribosylaminopyrimidine deaminase/5-amino-6-(5-phosphoribosylamino)uracil reductase